MKVLAWNVQQGGARRANAIIEAVVRVTPDVLLLTELRRSSTRLLQDLAVRGWSHQLVDDLPIRTGAAGILSRSPLERLPQSDPATVLPGRWIEARSNEFDATVAAVYGPLHREPFNEFWEAVAAVLPDRVGAAFLMAGDLNTGKSIGDAPHRNFFCSAHFARLQAGGLQDLWRQTYGEAREFSFHHRLRDGALGAGFRIDHALGSPRLAARLKHCSYDHQVRLDRTSDHSAMLAEFSPPAL